MTLQQFKVNLALALLAVVCYVIGFYSCREKVEAAIWDDLLRAGDLVNKYLLEDVLCRVKTLTPLPFRRHDPDCE